MKGHYDDQTNLRNSSYLNLAGTFRPTYRLEQKYSRQSSQLKTDPDLTVVPWHQIIKMIWNTEEILDHWRSNVLEKEKCNATIYSNQVFVENYSLPYLTGVS
jgi:hypothetical protein